MQSASRESNSLSIFADLMKKFHKKHISHSISGCISLFVSSTEPFSQTATAEGYM